VVDNPGDPPRCAICQTSAGWRWETRRTHPHNIQNVA
jgi:hypothetical protein